MLVKNSSALYTKSMRKKSSKVKIIKSKAKSKKKLTRPKSITSRENGMKGGAPAKLETIEKHLNKFLNLIALGATDEQIGVALGMSISTVVKYKRHDRFLRAVEQSEKFAKARVRRAIYKRALGYTHQEENIFCYKGEIVRAQTIKHYAPDMGAADMWMRNKDETWKGNRPDITNTVTNINKVTNNTIKPEDVTEETRERVANNFKILERNGLLGDKAEH